MDWRKLLMTPVAAALAMCASAALAGTLTFQGVTFSTSSSAASLLTIEIDASGRTGDWADAMSMDMIAIKDFGTFSTVSLLGPGGAWTYSPNELNAKGCEGGASGGACFSHGPVALTDNMKFDFTFAGGLQNFDEPALKVRFLDASGAKVGSLLSATIPARVSEPSVYALLLSGFAALFLAMLRKRRAQALQV